jgi:hypothetical protein
MAKHGLSTLPASLSLRAQQDDICLVFLRTSLFAGGFNIQLETLNPIENDPTSASAASMQALSKVYFGRMNKHTGLVRDGTVAYGAALQQLARDIQNPATAGGLSVLKTATALFLYEVCLACVIFFFVQHHSSTVANIVP